MSTLMFNLPDSNMVDREVMRRKAEKARRSLHFFLEHFAWPVLLPGTPFQDNWHIRVICEHLEAITHGDIQNLIINLPFRMLKSTIVSQAWPAWEWIARPSLQYLTASYAKDVATRDAVDSRRIIESTSYADNFGDSFVMTTDQNVKTRFENNKRGMRVVTSTEGAGTGFGGNRIIIDDPVSALEANNESARKGSVEWYKGTAATRLNNPKEDAKIIVHQRLHEDDLTGYLLKEEKSIGWEHLILPMRYDPDPKFFVPSTVGFLDPRTEKGELMFPARLPEEVVKAMETTLGPYHTAAQLQQRPNSRGGHVLNSATLTRYRVHPKLKMRRIYGDTAQKTKERHDYSVFIAVGLGIDDKLYLLDLIRGKWEAPGLLTQCIDFWNKHKPYDRVDSCPLNKLKIEDKASGTGLIQSIKKDYNIPVEGIPRSIDKLVRAYDAQPYIDNGSVCVPEEASWVKDYCDEMDAFTKDDTHAFDDQLDPTFDAINDLLAGAGKTLKVWSNL